MFTGMGYKRMLLLIFLLYHAPAMAQNPFVEGRITYAVSMDPSPDQSGITQHGGTYTIYIKGRMFRKELKLDNGYESTVIWDGNTHTAYSIPPSAQEPIAVQLSRQDLEASQKSYRKFRLKDAEGSQQVGGWSCRPATVSYPNGNQSNICYSRDWTISESLLYEWFPGISFLPLSFEFRNGSGMLLRFHAESVTEIPLESTLFRLPGNYRILSNREYQKMKD